jgi:hypothetical protein
MAIPVEAALRQAPQLVRVTQPVPATQREPE